MLRMFRRVPLVSATVLVAAFLPATARADQPAKQSFPLHVTYSQAPNTFLNPCSFPVTITEAGTLELTTFFDTSGQPNRLLIRTPQFTWTFTGPNGTSLTSRSPSPTMYDGPPTQYTVHVDGMELDFHMPGSGTLFKIAGHWSRSFDFTTSPPTISPVTFTGKITGDTTRFCSLLSS